MAATTSLVTAVNHTNFNNWFVNNGAVGRVRDQELAICTAFGNLSVPAGATIDGIVISLEGSAGNTNHDAAVGDWIYVSNDGGSSWSTAKSVTTGTWVVYTGSQTDAVENAGGVSELWGETWTPTTANAIQVKFYWPSLLSNAVYLDYVEMKILYTEGVVVVVPKSLSINGSLNLNGKLTIK
tara:strand:+ start:193 stop:738 length:546 start_codon:yes stop_codon:yes gene_type:complete